MGERGAEGKKESFTDAYRLAVSCIRVPLGVPLHVFRSPLSRLYIAHNSQHPHALIKRISRKREIMN